LTEASLETYFNMLVNAHEGLYPEAKWSEKSIKEINGKKVAVLAYETPDNLGGAYDLIFVLIVEGKAVQCTFNCSKDFKEDWIPKSKDMLNSVNALD